MTEQTYTETTLAARRVSLVRNPGTAGQRAIRTLDGNRADHRAAALSFARRTYPGQSLAWLDHATTTLHLVSGDEQ